MTPRSPEDLPLPSVPCRPPRWAASGHAQTILGNFWPVSLPERTSTAEEVLLPDGDRLRLRCFAGARDVLVCVFHGLGGHDKRPYVRRVTELCCARDLEVWTVNHRGCGSGRGLARGTYHSGVAADLGAVFTRARALRPDARILAIGFSLSANALLLNLGDGHDGPHAKPDLAIAVNPPVDLARCSELISHPRHRLFNAFFVRSCVRSVRERELDGLIPAGRYPVHTRMTLAEFDDVYTAPAGGFTDRHDYYARCSARPVLPRITTPTVILHAEDDPFIDARDLKTAELGPGVRLHLERHGGHLGYISRDAPYRRWLDYALGHYVDALTALPAAR